MTVIAPERPPVGATEHSRPQSLADLHALLVANIDDVVYVGEDLAAELRLPVGTVLAGGSRE